MDEAGIWLRDHLKESGMHIEGVIEESGRPTIVKQDLPQRDSSFFAWIMRLQDAL